MNTDASRSVKILTLQHDLTIPPPAYLPFPNPHPPTHTIFWKPFTIENEHKI